MLGNFYTSACDFFAIILCTLFKFKQVDLLEDTNYPFKLSLTQPEM